MRDLAAAYKVWKDDQSRLVPLITLYDIVVNDSTTLRLVEGDPDGTGTITFGGNTYTACAIQREAHEENVEGNFPTFRLQVSNINGVAGGYIEANELDGRQVTIRTGLLRGTESDFLTETYTISGASYNRKTALLQLGPPNFFKRKSCPRKFQRMRCQHSWAKRFEDDAGCGYPSDTFEADTHELFRLNTDSEKELKFGWFSLNGLKNGLPCVDGNEIATPASAGGVVRYPPLISIDGVYPGVLRMGSNSEDIEWEPGNLNAPFIYKKISGDFEVITEVLPYQVRPGFFAGLLCQSVDVLSSWVYLGLALDGWSTHVRAMAAEAGVLNPPLDVESSIQAWVRMVRVGYDFTCYYGTDGVTWTSLGTQTVAMDDDIRLGLCLSAARLETGYVETGFSIFQFRSGGDSACERTREACRLKGNVHRYGAFPGIPTLR